MIFNIIFRDWRAQVQFAHFFLISYAFPKILPYLSYYDLRILSTILLQMSYHTVNSYTVYTSKFGVLSEINQHMPITAVNWLH